MIIIDDHHDVDIVSFHFSQRQGLGRQAARARRSHRQGAHGLRAAHDLRGTRFDVGRRTSGEWHVFADDSSWI